MATETIQTPMVTTKIIGLELRVTPAMGQQVEVAVIPLDIDIVQPDPNISGIRANFNVTVHTSRGDGNSPNTKLNAVLQGQDDSKWQYSEEHGAYYIYERDLEEADRAAAADARTEAGGILP